LHAFETPNRVIANPRRTLAVSPKIDERVELSETAVTLGTQSHDLWKIRAEYHWNQA